MSDYIISVEKLSKKYTLGHQAEGYTRYVALRDVLANGIKSVGQKLARPFGGQTNKRTTDEFWALQDVSFNVQQGECLGIIGRNGAGKSTLLKILSRITEPTKGRISIKGRVASLLEVGTGFHPELTGRENIFLNGAILGMTRVEIKRKFDEIVAFAEVEKFLDTPVKRYSSGMYVRLAFAVAAHLEPEILVVDEVLAVGDAEFQKKCMGKMGEVAKGGRTVFFVSHNMMAIRTLCEKVLLMEKGKLICVGDTDSSIQQYMSRNLLMNDATWKRPANLATGSLSIMEIKAEVTGTQPDLTLELEVTLETKSKHKAAFVAVDIADTTGTVLMQSLPRLDGFITDAEPFHQIKVITQLPPMIPGHYLVTFWVGSHNLETLDEIKQAVMFEVVESPAKGRSFPYSPKHGYIVPPSNVTVGEKATDQKERVTAKTI
ncbi:MAG: Teichoic-acid-transporting ATPase [Pedosphaera sp.]|nr:Teichoic-acid-transporting ATPase [Pedosphaera sp.]